MSKIGFSGTLSTSTSPMSYGAPWTMANGASGPGPGLSALMTESKTSEAQAVIAHWVPAGDKTDYLEGECIFTTTAAANEDAVLFTPKSFNSQYGNTAMTCEAANSLARNLNFLGVCYAHDYSSSERPIYSTNRKVEIVVKGMANVRVAWEIFSPGYSLRWLLEAIDSQPGDAANSVRLTLVPYYCLRTTPPPIDRLVRLVNNGADVFIGKSFEVGSYYRTADKTNKQMTVFDPSQKNMTNTLASINLSAAYFRR